MTAERPTVVGIMPIYNGEAWIDQSLRSVVEQTLLPDEFIVVDDGSTDESRTIAERYAAEYPFIRVVSTPKNVGQSAARNFAIAMSECDYVALIDQDDAWYPNHIKVLTAAIRKHRGLRLGWVYSDFDDIDLDGNLINRDFIVRLNLQNPKRDLRTVLAQGFIIQPSATLINRRALLDVGGFDERLSGYEDDDLFLRIFMGNYDNVWVPQPTSQWRIHESSAGGTDRNDDSLRTYGQKLIEMFPDDKWRGIYYARDLIAPRILSVWLHMYIRASRLKDRTRMRRYAREALAYVKYLTPRQRVRMYWQVTMLRNPIVIRLRILSVDNNSLALAPFVALGRRAAGM